MTSSVADDEVNAARIPIQYAAWLQSKEIGVLDLTSGNRPSTPQGESGDSSDSDVQSFYSAATDDASDEELWPDGGVGLA